MEMPCEECLVLARCRQKIKTLGCSRCESFSVCEVVRRERTQLAGLKCPVLERYLSDNNFCGVQIAKAFHFLKDGRNLELQT